MHESIYWGLSTFQQSRTPVSHRFWYVVMLEYLTCQKSVSEFCNKIIKKQKDLPDLRTRIGCQFWSKKGTPSGLQWRFTNQDCCRKCLGFLLRGRKYMTKVGCVPFPRIIKSKLYLQKDILFSKQACVRKNPVISIRRKSTLHLLH